MEAVPFALADLAVRSALIALLLGTAGLLAREARGAWAGRLGALFVLGVAAYVAQGLGQTVRAAPAPSPAMLPIAALSAGNSVVLWLFARSLFDDDFRPSAWHVLPWLAMAAAGTQGCLAAWTGGTPAGWIDAALQAGIVTLSGLAAWEAVRNWRGDLVERRRELRGLIVFAGGGYSIAAALLRLAGQRTPGPGVASLVDALLLLALTLVVVGRLVGLRAAALQLLGPTAPPVRPDVPTPPAALTAPHPAPHPAPEMAASAETAAKGNAGPDADQPAAAPDGGSTAVPADPALLAELDRLMHQELVYQEPGLTIGGLAQRVGVPEYRLRRVINQSLGHRNFTAFLNGYRLDHARRALGDPAHDAVAIVEIALDAGFQSIGPFNRAFKAATGMTPSEYRQARGAPSVAHPAGAMPGEAVADSGIG